MAYRKPTDMNGFLLLMPKSDMRVRPQLAEDLVSFLSDTDNSVAGSDIGLLVDSLVPWLAGSNYKVAQKSLEAIIEIIKLLGGDFNAFIGIIFSHIIDRLGDNKEVVREKAQLTLQSLVDYKVLTPKSLLDKLTSRCPKHKNAKVREEFLQTLVRTLEQEYCTGQLGVRNYVQSVCLLMGDSSAPVRQAAYHTLVEMYKYVGDRLRNDIRRMNMISVSKLASLEQTFDQMKRQGYPYEMQRNGSHEANVDSCGIEQDIGNDNKDSASCSSHSNDNNTNGNDDGNGEDNFENTDISNADEVVKVQSCDLNNQSNGNSSNSNESGGNNQDEVDNNAVSLAAVASVASIPQEAKVPRMLSKRTVSALRHKGGCEAADAGAVTIEIFEASFLLLPPLTIFNMKDVEENYRYIVSILNDKTADWDKRIDAIRKVRSLLGPNMSTYQNYIISCLKELSISFLDLLKEELRSQVIREACITIAFMSKSLVIKLDKFCETILDQLIHLIQNSAKVIASSSTIALKYIVTNTHAPKLLKIIADNCVTSKSKDIRSTLSEIIYFICTEWPSRILERHNNLLRDTLKKTLVDADSEARRHSRRAYWVFRQHFPALSEQVYNSLDFATQKTLDRERQQYETPVSDRQCATPGTRMGRSVSVAHKHISKVRSISAVDTSAAQRAKSRVQYVALSRKKMQRTPTGIPQARLANNNIVPTTSTNTSSRDRSTITQSQPGSRSSSPSSKYRDQSGCSAYRATGTIPKRASGIPRSLASSRESSPTRSSTLIGPIKVSQSYGRCRRTPDRNTPVRQPAAARILQQSREAENQISDCQESNSYISMDYARERSSGTSIGGVGSGISCHSIGGRVGRRVLTREESDESEASSVCSERSFDSSYTRNNFNYSLAGSRGRLDCNWPRPTFEDIETIIMLCASTHWSERKDGLISLSYYLAEGKEISPYQLQSILDTFRKMFMDTHTKVYTLFLETITELILAYSNELHDWLFILLSRLFNKLGTELLNSMHGKIWKTLQVVHECFPTELQLKDVFRILSDVAQTPSTKARIAILKFLTNLANNYCKNIDFPCAEDGSISISTEKAILKIVQVASDQKSLELRNQARYCLVALYNLNTPIMTRILSSLPKSYQDAAKSCIQSYLRQSSTSNENSPSSPPLTTSSVIGGCQGGPFVSLQTQYTSPRSRQISLTDNSLLHGYSEIDVHQNIQKTTEEIRNCFGCSSNIDEQFNSLMNHNTNGSSSNGHLCETLDSCASSNSKTHSSATTTESNTPESTTIRLDSSLLEQRHHQHHQQLLLQQHHHHPQQQPQQQHNKKLSPQSCLNIQRNLNFNPSKTEFDYNFDENGELIIENNIQESEVIRKALTLKLETPCLEVQSTLTYLSVCIKAGNCELPNKHFMAIMKMLLNLLDSTNYIIICEALHLLARILRSTQMKEKWLNFVELILLKIIDCYPKSKEVSRELDVLIPRFVPSLPLDHTINIIKPLIITGPYPINLCALKLLNELVSSQWTELHLDTVFPNLATLTDNRDSSIRKAAVFCIVKLYIVMGEDKVKPKVDQLHPSKVRLLNVYIDKQRANTSATVANSDNAADSPNNATTTTAATVVTATTTTGAS